MITLHFCCKLFGAATNIQQKTPIKDDLDKIIMAIHIRTWGFRFEVCSDVFWHIEYCYYGLDDDDGYSICTYGAGESCKVIMICIGLK